MSEIIEKKLRKNLPVQTEAETTAEPKSIMESIPIDLIASDIFSRLPMKAIVQCKFVCKTWCNLLNDPIFIKNYQKYPPFTTLLASYFQDCLVTKQVFYMVEVSENRSDSCIQTRINLKDLECGSTEDGCYLQLKGSCKGLLLLSYDGSDDVYICNPFTREIILLPQSELPCDSSINGDALYRFDYISATNQFKVLRIFINRSYGYDPVVEIFTIGVDVEWRHIPDFDFKHPPMYGDEVIFNGVFHWYVWPYDDTSLIHTFDLGEEKVGPCIPPPPGISMQIALEKYGHQLKELSGHLSLVVYRLHGCIIWIMNEYGIAESWTKEVISTTWVPRDIWKVLISTPVARLRNRNILFSGIDDNHFLIISIDTKLKKCTKMKVCEAEESPWHSEMPYTISFSPSFSFRS